MTDFKLGEKVELPEYLGGKQGSIFATLLPHGTWGTMCVVEIYSQARVHYALVAREDLQPAPCPTCGRPNP